MNKVDVYYQVAAGHRLEQEQRNRDFDLKAMGCAGIATTITSMGAILLNGILSAPIRELTVLPIALICLTALVYLGALASSLLVIMLRDWRIDPVLNLFARHLPGFEDRAIVEWAGDQFRNAAEENSKILAKKGRLLTATFCLTGCLPVLLFILVFVLGW